MISPVLPRRLLALAAVLGVLLASAGGPLRARAAHLNGGADWPIVVDSDFSSQSAAPWPVRATSDAREHLAAGRYTVSVGTGMTTVVTPPHLRVLGDGLIAATFRLEGSGQVGIVARQNVDTNTSYTFWINAEGIVGATRYASGSYSDLFELHQAGVRRGADNTLVLQAQGGLLTFLLNGQQIYRFTDRLPLPAGLWGLYVDGSPETSAVQGHFSHVTISGPAATATTLDPGPFKPLIGYDFAFGDNHGWTEGHYPYVNAHIDDGAYTISTKNFYTQMGYPRLFQPLGNGQIGATMRMEGEGQVGVAGRRSIENGLWSLYACWIDDRGDVGLIKELQATRTTLKEFHSDNVQPARLTTIALRIDGTHVSCFVNDRRVAAYTDPHPLPPGRWGAWVSDYPGGPYVQGHFRQILISG